MHLYLYNYICNPNQICNYCIVIDPDGEIKLYVCKFRWLITVLKHDLEAENLVYHLQEELLNKKPGKNKLKPDAFPKIFKYAATKQGK